MDDESPTGAAHQAAHDPVTAVRPVIDTILRTAGIDPASIERERSSDEQASNLWDEVEREIAHWILESQEEALATAAKARADANALMASALRDVESLRAEADRLLSDARAQRDVMLGQAKATAAHVTALAAREAATLLVRAVSSSDDSSTPLEEAHTILDEAMAAADQLRTASAEEIAAMRASAARQLVVVGDVLDRIRGDLGAVAASASTAGHSVAAALKALGRSTDNTPS